MGGWLVNDRLTLIPGTVTFWNHLLAAIPGLEPVTAPYTELAQKVNAQAAEKKPDFIIRNACYFPPLSVDCPVISLVQDVMTGRGVREWLIETCSASAMVVFNSEYTRSRYPELHECRHEIIPIGTDTTIFQPRHNYLAYGGVMWVGSGHSIKGFDLAVRLASESKRRWVMVFKDDTVVDLPNVTTFRQVPQRILADVASLCAVGVCTSREETQHLAGIEMGMCGLPLVTTNVGAYYDREPGAWGRVTSGDWFADIEEAAKLPQDEAAAYWRDEGFGVEECMNAWKALIASVVPARV